MLHPAWLGHVEADADTPYPLRWYALLFICLALFIGQIDITIVNIALPSIAADLDATTSDLQWTVDAYLVMLAGFVLFGGGLADRFGRKGVFMTGLALFGAASLGATFATEPGHLIAARAFMGLGAALFFPPALSMLATIFAPGERARAVAVWAAVGGIATALGPVVGGVLLSRYWWGSVFLVNVPVVVAALVGAALLIPTSRRPGSPKLDGVGALLSVLGLAALVFGIIEGPDRGWGTPLIVASLLMGGVLVGAFVAWESRLEEPMVDVRVFRLRGVSAGGLAVTTNLAAMAGVLFLIPLYLQSVVGLSTTTIGLLLLPFGVVFMCLAFAAGPATRRFGVRPILTGGLLVMAAGTLLLSFLPDVGRDTLSVMVGMAVFGAGAAFVAPPATTAIMNALPTAKAGDGSAVNQVTRQVGAALGAAVVGTVLVSVYAHDLAPSLTGLSSADASVADSSIAGAQKVAAKLTSGSDALLDAADSAFSSGFRVAMLVPALLAVGVAGAVLLALRSDP